MTLVSVGVLAGCVMARAAADGAMLLCIWLLPVTMMPLHCVNLAVTPWLLLGFYYWLLRQTVRTKDGPSTRLQSTSNTT